MKINRENFLNALDAVSPGLSTKDIIEQSSSVIFKDGRIITFNDEVSFRVKTDVDIQGAVVAGPLLSLLRKIRDQEIDIECSDGNILITSETAGKSEIRIEEKIVLPIEHIEEPSEWKKVDASFENGIEVVQHCCGKDDGNFVLTCIRINKSYVEAMDNYQMCRYSTKSGIEDPVVVRRSALRLVCGRKMNEVSETEKWIHFRNEQGVVFSCRKYVEKYPELDKYLDITGEQLVFPDGLVEKIEIASIFSEGNNNDFNQVKVELRQGKMRVSGQGDHGKFTSKSIQTEYKGDNLEFMISPRLLIEITKKSNKCEIMEGKLKVTGEKFRYVTVTGKVK